MEATGASRFVQQFFADGTVCIGEYSSDDDSLSQTIFTHSNQDLIEAGLVTNTLFGE
jgi:hypothetical protein